MDSTAAGRPEKHEVRIGFIPLTDCAPVVMAAELGFDRRHGVRIVPTREASWANIRDKLVAGTLDMAHALYGLVYGVHLGLGSARHAMAVLMTLNRNGQGLTLSRALAERGAVDAVSLARLMAAESRRFTFAQTFPTGTHAMWLYYWLASAGIAPLRDARVVTVPPPQMVTNMQQGNVDGFSVGEPWNQRAQLDGAGMLAATSQQVWPEHPEKVLGSTDAFVSAHPNTARAAVAALLEASRWIDASDEHKAEAAATLARPEYIDTPVETLLPRLLGQYDDGFGRRWQDTHALRFHDDGAVNFPYLSDGMWFLTQYRRWGLLREHPPYRAVASEINRIDIYKQAAARVDVLLPPSPLRSSRLIDGVVWDGSDPARYADAFTVHGRAAAPTPA